MAISTNMRRIARDARKLPRILVDDATMALQKGVTKTLKADTGGDASLSNAPTKLRVARKVSGETIVKGEVSTGKRGAGQWAWLESGTMPHGGHPGTSAKETWSRAVEPGLRVVNRMMLERFNRSVRL